MGGEEAGIMTDIAINHDEAAILMHSENHPYTIHLTENMLTVDLKKYLNNAIVTLMWASPDCTGYSKAKGDQPREQGLRILPWSVYRLCRQILKYTGSLPEVLIIENVEEIQKWGPVDENGRIIKERIGEDYRKFVASMKKLGFTFECRELVAADYGAPTNRKRWYAVLRSDGRETVWPEPTHNKLGENGLQKWIPVSTVLDWSDLGKSIFGRKKPLAENTLNRIARGIRKFIVENPEPYILPDEKAASFLIQYHTETKNEYVRGQNVTEPIKTIDTSNRYGLVTAFITKYYKSGTGQNVTEPLHTITTSPGHFGLVSAFLIKYYGSGTGQSVQEPIGTIVTKDRFGLITVVIKGETYQIVDIRLRMLKPEELKLAQGFPKDYIIDFKHNGKRYPIKEQVARIGNSVVPVMAKVLIESNCPYLKKGERMPNMRIDDSEQQLKFV